MVIDIHAHVFPDAIARRAAQSIGAFYDGADMRHGGGVEELLLAMDAGGVDAAVVHSVALSPAQAGPINRFIQSAVAAHPGRLYGFAALHPDCENIGALLDDALLAGLRGVKIHSDMQRVSLTDRRMDALYAACQGVCPLLLHAGDARYQYDTPRQIAAVAARYPRLRLICAHLGGYTQWDEAVRFLADTDVLVDTSSSHFKLGDEKMRAVIRRFGARRVLFGSDYPMWNPGQELALIRALGLAEDELALILHGNVQKLLNIGLNNV